MSHLSLIFGLGFQNQAYSESRAFLYLLGLIVLFTTPLSASAQIAPQTDSLSVLLQQSTGRQRVEVLIKLSNQIRRSSIDSAITYAQEALDISQRIENETLQGNSHNSLGWFLTDKGEYPDALKHFLEAKRIFEKIGNLRREVVVLENIGKLYSSQSNYSKALEYYFSALNLEEQLNDRQRIANILLSIGSVYYQMDQPEESISFYKRALKISEQLDDASNIAISATDLGHIYTSMEKTERALEAYNKALEASEELPGAHARATILMELSSVYNDNNSYQKALEINNQALSLAREMSDKMLESLALKNMAAIYRKQGDFSRANTYLVQTLSLLDEIGAEQSIVETKNYIAQNFYDLGAFEKTIEYGSEAYDAAIKAHSFDLSLEPLRLMANSYRQMGDYEQAFATQQSINSVKDSIYNQEQARQIAQMQTRYETKQKEQEIALLQNKNEKAELIRNAFIAGLVLIFIIGFLVYNRQRLKIKKNKTDLENTRLKEQQLKQDLEFKNKQLTTHSLNLVQKNKAMKELKQNIKNVREQPKDKIKNKLHGLEHLVDYSFNLDEDWEAFRHYFEEVHTGFFEALKKQYPDLTPNELRLSALVKLHLTIKEIATIMSISPDSVKTARCRLRKKLGMKTEENLTDFMMEVESQVSNQV